MGIYTQMWVNLHEKGYILLKCIEIGYSAPEMGDFTQV